MEAAPLSKINLGAPAAERDNLLLDDFVSSEAFDALKEGKASILIGNRGSGKSALLRYLAEEERKRGSIICEVSPDEYSYEILNDVLRKELQGNWQKQSAYSASWKYVFYILAMKAISKDVNAKKIISYNAISNFLRDNFKGHQDSPLDALISYMKRLEHVKIDNVGEVGRAKQLQSLYQLEDVSSKLGALRDLLENRRVLILVDELDRGWDASEDARQFVAGLFQAAIQVNQLSPNLRVLVSLRRELYDNIPELYEDAQKVRDLVRYVKWDEEGLKKLITKRMSRSLQSPWKEAKVDQIWGGLFEQTLSYRKANSFNYVVDRTLWRPRELIQFCNQCLSGAEEGTIRIDYDIISDAERKYSEERLKDIAAEYRFSYPGLLDVLETFRGLPYNIAREALELHCLELITGERKCEKASGWMSQADERRVIGILWECGFIKGLTVGGFKGGARSGSRYVGVYQVETVNIDEIKQFQIHPMFRVHLGLKEK